MKLKLLKSPKKVLSVDYLTQGKQPIISDPEVEHYGEGESPDYPAIRELVLSFIGDENATRQQKTPVDAKLGIELHKSLRLTRREASQGKFWAYLATQIPEFYSWRWGETGNRWRDDWKRNGLSWAWWWAELTVDYESEDPYEATLNCHSSRMHLWVIDTPATSTEYMRKQIVNGKAEDDASIKNYTDPVWIQTRARLSTTVVGAFDKSNQHKITQNWISEFRDPEDGSRFSLSEDEGVPVRVLLSPEAIERNRQFNNELEERGLCLAVTRTWGQRTLDTRSTEWRSLRAKVMRRDHNKCRFCGIQSTSHMVCDHIDGNASDNHLDNLGVNCPLCDRIRHCGLAGMQRKLSLWKSSLSQLEIVKMSIDYWKEHGSIPNPNQLDPDAQFVHDDTIEFANILLEKNYSELNDEELTYRGFFKEGSQAEFNSILPFNG